MRGLSTVVETLLIIGALNWGLIGFFDYNVVQDFFGPVLERIVYAVVGVAALYEVFAWRTHHASLAPRLTARSRT